MRRTYQDKYMTVAFLIYLLKWKYNDEDQSIIIDSLGKYRNNTSSSQERAIIEDSCILL